MQHDSGEERACTLEACARQHISNACGTFPYKEHNASQQDEFSQLLLLLCKSGIISSLIGSPWFCGATAHSPQKARASIDAHHDSFAVHHFCYASMLATNYAYMATEEKPCSTTCSAETRRLCASPVAVCFVLICFVLFCFVFCFALFCFLFCLLVA